MDRLQKILNDHLSIIVFSLDKDYRYLYYNKLHAETMKNLWGVDIQKGVSMLDYISNEKDCKKAKENFDRALSGNDFILVEEYGDRNHSRKFYQDIYTPIFDETNHVIGISVYVIDISEQKRRELDIHRNEKRFRTIIEDTVEGILAISISSNKVVYANPSCCKMFEYSSEEFQNLEFKNLFKLDFLELAKQLLLNHNSKGKLDRIPFVKKNDEPFFTEIKTSEIFLNNEECKLFYLNDITREVENKQRLILHDKLLNTIGQAIIASDLSGKIIFWNNGAEKFYGWKSEEVLGRPVVEITTIKQSQSEAEEIFKELKAGKSWDGYFKVKNKKDQEFSVLVSNTPVFDEFNQLIAIIGVTTDLSQHLKIENKLKESERQYKSILSSLSEGLVVHDINDKITFSNDSAARILGLTQKQLLGKDSYDPNWEALKIDGTPFKPEEHPSMITLRTGQEVDNVLMNIHTGNGERKIISVNTRVIHNESGKLEGVVASFSDITNEHLALTAIRENEERLKRISDSVSGAVLQYKLSPDGKDSILYLSKGAKVLWEKEVDDVLKNSSLLWESILEEDLNTMQLSIKNSAQNLSYWNHEWRIKPKSGKVKWLNGKGMPSKLDDGSVIWDMLILDITNHKEALLRLDENQKLLKSINQNISEGIYRSNEKGVIYVNKAFLEMFKYDSLEELQEMKATEIYYKTETRKELTEQLENDGFFSNVEVEFLRKDGSVFIGLISSTIYKDAKGNSFWDGAIRDISEERSANVKIRESEQLLKSINKNINEAIYRSISKKGLVYINDEFVRMFGYESKEELMMIDPMQLYKYNSDREKLGDELISYGSYVNREVEFKRKDGSNFWGAISSIKTEGENGEIYFDGAIRDITLQKQAELSLKNQAAMQDLLRTISSRFININLEEVDDAINASLKELGLFAHVDRSYVFDFDIPNNLCKNTFEWCREGISSQIDKLQNIDLDAYPEMSNKLKNGDFLLIPIVEKMPESNLKKLFDDHEIKSVVAVPMMLSNTCLGYVGFDAVSDIKIFGNKELALLSIFSDLIQNIKNKSQKQLELNQLLNTTSDQNKRLKDFSFMTSHNIRSSVSNLLGLSQLILDEPRENNNLLELLHKTAVKLDTTIKNINQILNLESSFQLKEMVPCNVKEAINRVLELNQKMIDEKGIVLGIDIDEDLTVSVIPAFLDSIFYNLISNAFKYGITRNSKTIEIWSKEIEDYTVIYVKDMGWGMDLEKHMDRLFKLGSRLHESSDGQGLGLYMTKHQILELGGKIELESEVNVGTTFSVYFPKRRIKILN